jgi:hypothetical protein
MGVYLKVNGRKTNNMVMQKRSGQMVLISMGIT